jgi:hypothetical protein
MITLYQFAPAWGIPNHRISGGLEGRHRKRLQ